MLNDIPATKEDIRAAAGQIIVCGFATTHVTSELRELLREAKPLGLILFARNVESPEQVTELNRELKSLRPDAPLLLSVDQEGGRVARIRQPATEWPPMGQLAALDDAALTRQVAVAVGRELRAMGFDIDYAPVLDVNTNPNNPIIGDRAFGAEPAAVARHGAAFVRGLLEAGVGPCGKHFPGHGDTDVDSHLALPRVEHELPRLQEIDWPPFAAAIAAGLDAIMTAHVVVSCLDEERPATLSPTVLQALRRDLKYSGLIISDDLEMKAVANHYAVTEMAELGLNAGVDLFLACERPELVIELYGAIVRGVEDGRISKRTLLGAARRARHWHNSHYQPSMPWDQARHIIGCQQHADLRHEIEQRLLRG